jgi:hypothetical protein
VQDLHLQGVPSRHTRLLPFGDGVRGHRLHGSMVPLVPTVLIVAPGVGKTVMPPLRKARPKQGVDQRHLVLCVCLLDVTSSLIRHPRFLREARSLELMRAIGKAGKLNARSEAAMGGPSSPQPLISFKEGRLGGFIVFLLLYCDLATLDL